MKSRNGPHKTPFVGELAAQRRSERLKDSPYAQGMSRIFFVTYDCVIPIA